jgi:hypothetical protein
MLAQRRRCTVPVFVKMQNRNEMAIVTDGVTAKEKSGALEVFDSKGSLVGRFQKVQEWYVGQAEPLKGKE